MSLKVVLPSLFDDQLCKCNIPLLVTFCSSLRLDSSDLSKYITCVMLH